MQSDKLTAAVTALAEAGVPVDVQELLLKNNALGKALEAALSTDAEPVRWMWEERRSADIDIWDDMYDDEKPAPHKYVRNVRALYAEPVKTAPAVAVRVKPLEWYKPSYSDTLRRADTVLGVYRVWTHHEAEGKWFWKVEASIQISGEASDEAEAKAAAQADYDARIRSALSTQVQDVAVPEGWQLVPKEPTSDMISIAYAAGEASEEGIREMWTDMLARAPSSPASKHGDEE